jgi:hypothetical protein
MLLNCIVIFHYLQVFDLYNILGNSFYLEALLLVWATMMWYKWLLEWTEEGIDDL